MTKGDEVSEEIAVLIKVLDLLELSMRSRGLSNNDTIQINQVINQFLGSSTGAIIQTQASPGAEVMVGDEYSIGDHSQIGAVGKSAHVDQVSFSMSESGGPSDSSIAVLLEELAKLRLEMRRQAARSEEHTSVVAIGDAISFAEKGDSPRTLEYLRSAGKWALSIATSI